MTTGNLSHETRNFHSFREMRSLRSFRFFFSRFSLLFVTKGLMGSKLEHTAQPTPCRSFSEHLVSDLTEPGTIGERANYTLPVNEGRPVPLSLLCCRICALMNNVVTYGTTSEMNSPHNGVPLESLMESGSMSQARNAG